MTKVTPSVLVAAAVSMGLVAPISSLAGGTPLASAGPPSASAAVMPMVGRFRACDFTTLKWVDPVGSARPTAHVGSTGTGTVAAAIDINTAVPNTRYDVRLIQLPRPSIGCAPGAPGVLTGFLQTDDIGGGATTLAGPIAPGATGAWLILERPAEYSQTPAEFYTTTFVASI